MNNSAKLILQNILFLMCILATSCEDSIENKDVIDPFTLPSEFGDSISFRGDLGNAYDISYHEAKVPILIRHMGDVEISDLILCYSFRNPEPGLNDETYRFEFNYSQTDSLLLVANLDSLTHDTTYYYRLYFKTIEDFDTLTYIKSFSLLLDPKFPVVKNALPESTTRFSTIFHGNIVDEGENATIVSKGFLISQSPNPSFYNRLFNIELSATDISTTLVDNLNEGEKYYYSFYATNEYGTQISHQDSFYTATSFSKTYGGGGFEDMYGLFQTKDGGFISAGYTNSNKLSALVGNHGENDGYIIKTYANGEIEWETCVGGPLKDALYNVIQTKDGGFMAIGGTQGSVEGLEGYKGEGDVYVVKLNRSGHVLWQRCFGGSNGDTGINMIECNDGGVIIATITTSDDGDISMPYISQNAWLFKISEFGNLLWDKSLNQHSVNAHVGMCEGHKSNTVSVVVSGAKFPNAWDSDDKNYQTWITTINSDGETISMIDKIRFDKINTGTYDLTTTHDGGYAITGYAITDYTSSGMNYDCWVAKISSEGNEEWLYNYGGTKLESGNNILQMQDNTLLIAGLANSTDGDISSNYGNDDVWILNLDLNGKIISEKTFGGSGEERVRSLLQTKDGSIVFSGKTRSDDHDVKESDQEDGWIYRYY